MHTRFATLLVAAWLTLVCHTAPAQTSKTPVQVVHSGRDNVGSRLAFELRETIRGSNSMRYVLESEADPRIVVQMVTQEANSSYPGVGTDAAIAIVYDGKFVDGNGIFLTLLVQNCGSQRTSECARNIAADIDGEVEKFRKNWPGLARLLR